jgi:iron complex transport system ATP-binding protein
MHEIHCENLGVSYNKRIVIENLNVKIKKHKITALIGSNGSGKSTILKVLSRIILPTSGSVYLDGKSIQSYPSQEVAKILSILPQSPEAPQELTVEQLVKYGRFPRQSFFGTHRPEDEIAIQWALKVTGMTEFSSRRLTDLSGGQRQRAWISMALAQGGDYLFLDEPTTYLDMRHQIEVLSVLKKLNEDQGKTIVMVVHDINHAAKFAHHIIAIKNGVVVNEGSIHEVLNEKVIENIFGVKGIVIYNKNENIPLFFPQEVSYV